MADLVTEGRSTLTDLAVFRLDRFAAHADAGSGAFSHSYLS